MIMRPGEILDIKIAPLAFEFLGEDNILIKSSSYSWHGDNSISRAIPAEHCAGTEHRCQEERELITLKAADVQIMRDRCIQRKKLSPASPFLVSSASCRAHNTAG